jgi:transcriptional regulator with XRE-family HTH domain
MNDGEAIRKIRINKDLSQQYVSSKLGISQKTLSEWEHKEYLNHEKINKLLKVMETTINIFNALKEEKLQEKDFTENYIYQEKLDKILTIVEEHSKILKQLKENHNKTNLE